MSQHFTTRQVSEFIGVEEWRIRRLFECGDIGEPERFAGRRMLQSCHVQLIVEALRKRGWFPSSEKTEGTRRQEACHA